MRRSIHLGRKWFGFSEGENGKQLVVVERAKGVRRSVPLLGFEMKWIAKRMLCWIFYIWIQTLGWI